MRERQERHERHERRGGRSAGAAPRILVSASAFAVAFACSAGGWAGGSARGQSLEAEPTGAGATGAGMEGAGGPALVDDAGHASPAAVLVATYDVAPLTARRPQIAMPVLGVRVQHAYTASGGTVLSFDGDTTAAIDEDALRDLLLASVEAGSWDLDERIDMYTIGHQLVVQHTERAHRQVAATLAALEGALAVDVDIDVIVLGGLSQGAVQEALGAGARGAAAHLLAAAPRDESSVRLRGRGQAGLEAVLSATEEALYIADYEVNHKGVQPVASALLGRLTTGDAIGVTPFPAGRGRLLLAVRFDRAREAGPRRVLDAACGPLEAAVAARWVGGTVVLVAAGVPTLCALVPEVGPAGAVGGYTAAIVTARVLGASADGLVAEVPVGAGASRLGIYPVAALAHEDVTPPPQPQPGSLLRSSSGAAPPGLQESNGSLRFEGGDDDACRWPDASDIHEEIEALLEATPDHGFEGEVAFATGHVLVAHTAYGHKMVERYLADLDRHVARQLFVEALLVDGSGWGSGDRHDHQEAGASVIPDAHLAALLAARQARWVGAAPVLDGAPAHLRSGLERDFLARTEYVNGGTGTSVTTVGDPVVSGLWTGLEVWARPRIRGDGQVAVEVAASATRAPGERVKDVLRPFLRDGVVEAEVPTVRGQRCHLVTRLDPGAATVIAGNDRDGYIALRVTVLD